MTDMEGIYTQHFTIKVNRRSPIIDPWGGDLRTMQPHYLRAKAELQLVSINTKRKKFALSLSKFAVPLTFAHVTYEF